MKTKMGPKSKSKYKKPKHGYEGSRTYRSWNSMKNRCNNPKAPDYDQYGGRGIKVCERWMNSFENFIDNMGVRPEGMSLDRIDNDKGYSPENCKWSTAKEQMRNRRANNNITLFGETGCISFFVEKYKTEAQTFIDMSRKGKNIDDEYLRYIRKYIYHHKGHCTHDSRFWKKGD